MADVEPLVWDTKLKKHEPGGLLPILGPALITGASVDDPSGIPTCSQSRVQFGFAHGGAMLFSWPPISAIQEIGARIGRVTGRGIAGRLGQRCLASLPLFIVALLAIPQIPIDKSYLTMVGATVAKGVATMAATWNS